MAAWYDAVLEVLLGFQYPSLLTRELWYLPYRNAPFGLGLSCRFRAGLKRQYTRLPKGQAMAL
jgi:hypothetical protein